MAETGASRQRSSSEKEEQSGSQLQRGSRGIERQGSYFPSTLALTPRDFFTMSPLGLMRRFADEMDRVFSNLGGASTGQSRGEELAWIPPVELRENDNKLVISAELPGLSENDVRVEATPEGLVIEGERKREQTGEEGGFQRSERIYGRFLRLIPLPEGANLEQARASFENGVLQVTIPVQQSQQNRRQIPISSGSRGQSQGQGQGGAGGQQRSRSASQSG